MTLPDTLATYVLRHGDDNLVLAQRLSELISKGPELEEDIALTNIALDHLGQARHFLQYAGELMGRSEDELAMLRTEREFTNVTLVELANGDFATTMARQFLFDSYQRLFYDNLSRCGDERLAGIAAKAVKEATYHLRHSSAWVVRLGDGTDESRRRMQGAVDGLWRFTGELFASDEVAVDVASSGIGVDPSTLHDEWKRNVVQVLNEATLTQPPEVPWHGMGRAGSHSEALGHLVAEMQWMQRTYPGASW